MTELLLECNNVTWFKHTTLAHTADSLAVASAIWCHLREFEKAKTMLGHVQGLYDRGSTRVNILSHVALRTRPIAGTSVFAVEHIGKQPQLVIDNARGAIHEYPSCGTVLMETLKSLHRQVMICMMEMKRFLGSQCLRSRSVGVGTVRRCSSHI